MSGSDALFRWTGWAAILLGAQLLLLLLLFVAGITLPLLSALGANALAYYLGATAGSVLAGLGTQLVAAAGDQGQARLPVALGAGIAFGLLASMRLLVALSGLETFAPLTLLLTGEILLFTGLSLVFFDVGADLGRRFLDVWRSFRATPLWVQVWVLVLLAPANLLSFGLYGATQNPVAAWAALSMAFVCLVNTTMALYERGISKATSIPHLLPWLPLQVYLGDWIFNRGAALAQSPEIRTFAIALFAINGISLAFDVLESVRWLRGQRDIAGAGRAPPSLGGAAESAARR